MDLLDDMPAGVTQEELNREVVLPRWARERLHCLRREVQRLKERVAVRDRVWSILEDEGADWFTLKFPSKPEGDLVYLFTLAENGAHPLCSLSRGDALFIARGSKEKTHGRTG